MTFTPDPYLTAEEVRQRISRGSPALAAATFTDTWVEETVSVFEGILETHKGVAYTTRETVESVRVPGCTDRLTLTWPLITDVVSVVVDGITVADSLVTITGPRSIRYAPGFAGADLVTVTYQHGFAEIPDVVKQMCAQYVEREAAVDRSGNTPDVSRVGFDGGSTVFIQADPAAGAMTPYADVNNKARTLESYRRAVA